MKANIYNTMICPNCDFKQNSSSEECERCGVIFERYFKKQKEKKPHEAEQKSDPTSKKEKWTSGSLTELLLHTHQDDNILFLIGRSIILLVIVIWGTTFVFSPIESNTAGNSFLHLVNLPFHEAGHVFFRPFGQFIASLGGTLGQLLMPLVCLVVLLLKTRDAFGAAITLWWFGQNFFDIAPYVNDARALVLPLVGGNVGHSSPYGFHDWEFLLTETGLLQYDHFIAGSLVVVGTIIFLLAYIWSGLLLFKHFRNISN